MMHRSTFVVSLACVVVVGCGGHVDLGSDPHGDSGGVSDDSRSGTTADARVDAAPDSGSIVPVGDASVDGDPSLDAFACTPPTFAGITSIDSVTDTTVTLHWSAATDDSTAAADIVYDVFVSPSLGGEDFAAPVLTTKGVTSAVISGLAPSTKYYFVVRARDASGCVSTTVKEASAITAVGCGSFATMVQPIFDRNCAVAGCHTLPTPPEGLALSSGLAYSNTVNVVSVQHAPMKRVQPYDVANSELFYAITGAVLPDGSAPPHSKSPTMTAAEVATVKCWIETGPFP